MKLNVRKTMEQQLISFHGKQKVKDHFISQVKAHALADEIVKGQYWENGKGCAVGCTIHGEDHSDYERELGLPEWLAFLEDRLFEGMSNEKAKRFPLEFLEAISVGSNLEKVKYQFCAYLGQENMERVEKLDISDDLKLEVNSAIEQVKALHVSAIESGSAAGSAAESARAAAESAAWSAAESVARSVARSAESVWLAAESAARSAAWSAACSAAGLAACSAAGLAAESARSTGCSAAESACSAAESACSAAGSVARSVARSAAESAAYDNYADILLGLLKAVK